MIIMITGGSKNGKSRTAEQIADSFRLKKYYIATMEPFSDEAACAIERHRKMRSGKGFETIEKYVDINDIVVEKESVVLLECIGNLCANEMFENGIEDPVFKIISGIKKIGDFSNVFVIVTSQVGNDGMEYPDPTMKYIENMGRLNRGIAEISDCVIEVVYGIPLVLKGEKPLCLC